VPFAPTVAASADGPDRGRAIEPANGARAELRGRRARLALLAAAGVAAVAIASSAALLIRADYFWQSPFATARFSRLTDFEGVEQDAAISRDGKVVAFLSDRAGAIDVWIKELETGVLRNLTQGRGGELRNPAVRTLGFSLDGANVTLWTRLTDSSAAAPAPIQLWAVPAAGGDLQRYLDGVAEFAWSPDGTRMVYHPAESGDPIFVTEPGETVGRRLFIGPPGLHCHFPVWSPDGAFIYFVYGSVPDRMDVWRIASTGSEPERVTFHDTRVSYPVFLDARTLAYLATDADGSGPWLHAMNVERRVPHRIGFGLEQYTSLSATANGRRLVATVATSRTSLWRVPILDRPASSNDTNRIALPTLGGLSPRLGRDYLLYLSPNNGELWKLEREGATKLWNGRDGRIAGGPAVAPNGDRIAFTVASGERTQLYSMNDDGTGIRRWAENLDVRGNPAWSPSGEWIAIAAERGGGPQLFKVPAGGARPIPILDDYSIDPAWSPDEQLIVYRGADSGPSFPLLAVTPDGAPQSIPALVLPRGARRVAFLAGGTQLVVLRGELEHKNFWLVDLASGRERQLTSFGPDFVIGDFDVSADGREIVFDRVSEESDVVLIDLTEPIARP
jgi:Tol biopolymer transport system component